MKTLKSKFCRSAPSVCCIKLHEINETEMTNARCCLYQIASVWICRFFFFFLAEISSTLFLDPLITLQKIIWYQVNWSRKYWTLKKQKKSSDTWALCTEKCELPLSGHLAVTVQNQESSLALRFTTCARSKVMYGHTLCW